MKFKVVGLNPQTSARMIFEVDAANRAAAEKQAHGKGMNVLHVEQVGDATLEALLASAPGEGRRSRRNEAPDGSTARAWLVAALLLLTALAGMLWWWSHSSGSIATSS